MSVDSATLSNEVFGKLQSAAHAVKSSCLNLVASENVLSDRVRGALSSSLALRYFIDDFPNSSELIELHQCVNKQMREIFKADYVCTAPLSGMNAMQITIRALARDGGRVYILRTEDGGHPSTPFVLKAFGLQTAYLPYDRTLCGVDVHALSKIFRREPPDLIYLDNSLVLFMADIPAIKTEAEQYKAAVVYDASHVLGLIAGGAFPNPLELGADAISGSTHKTFFGPQKGIILLSCEKLARKVEDFAEFFVSSTHAASLLALFLTGQEFLEFGVSYAKDTISNARALGHALLSHGFDIAGTHRGITDSHQVWINYAPLEARKAQKILADTGINCNAILIPSTGKMGLRLGTAELTRWGFGEREMSTIAELFFQCLRGNSSQAFVREQTRRLTSEFSVLRYC